MTQAPGKHFAVRDSASPRCLVALFAICGALLIPMRAFGESVLNDRPAPISAPHHNSGTA